MAHFAEIDDSNIVQRVLVVPNDEENRAQEFLAQDLALGGTWIQTSYSGRIRGKFAGIGDIYLPSPDLFVPSAPYPSWTLDEMSGEWSPPIPRPDEGYWDWDEDNQAWVEIPQEVSEA